jgi:hypothetical protein
VAVIAFDVQTRHSSMMTRAIFTLPRCAAALAVAAVAWHIPTAMAAPAGSSGAMVVPLKSVLRACDFSLIYGGAPQTNATVSSVIHVTGGAVIAEVHLSNPDSPGTHYELRLIQAPRPSNSTCDAPGPGVAVGGLDSDGSGQATSTLGDSIRPGTTGAWVFVSRPSEFNQVPAEFYTSDFVAPV